MAAAFQHYGQDIPQGLIPPELYDVEHEYWQAFCDLSGDRQEGGSIPWSAMRAYWQVEGFGDFSTFQRILSTMDGVLINSRKEDK